MQIEKYKTANLTLDTRIEDGQAWLTYEQVAELFEVDESVAGKHARSIVDDHELPSSVSARFAVTANDGKSYQKIHLNQDMVLHIGYRVRSERGSEFRRWATMVLKGKAPPLAPVQLSAARAALAQAQALVELEERQLAQARDIEALQAAETQRKASEEQRAIEVQSALALPAPAVDAPPKTDGQRTIERVRAWSIQHNGAFREAFGLLYKEVRYRLRLDLERREKNKKAKQRQSDIIDESGHAAEIYAIACELFRLE